MDVIHDSSQSRRVLNQLRLITTLKQVAPFVAKPVETIGKRSEQLLHPHRQVRLGRLQRQMEVVSHHDVRMNAPAVAPACLVQRAKTTEGPTDQTTKGPLNQRPELPPSPQADRRPPSRWSPSLSRLLALHTIAFSQSPIARLAPRAVSAVIAAVNHVVKGVGEKQPKFAGHRRSKRRAHPGCQLRNPLKTEYRSNPKPAALQVAS